MKQSMKRSLSVKARKVRLGIVRPVSMTRFESKTQKAALPREWGGRSAGAFTRHQFSRGLWKDIEKMNRFGPLGFGTTAKKQPMGPTYQAEPSWKKIRKDHQDTMNLATTFKPTMSPARQPTDPHLEVPKPVN